MPVTLPRESDGNMRRDGSKSLGCCSRTTKSKPSMSAEECTARQNSRLSTSLLLLKNLA